MAEIVNSNLNVNSIRTRLSQILDWINQPIQYSVLQETKVMDDSFPVEPFEKLGYSVEIRQKSYNGVAIISKIKPENVKKGFTVVIIPSKYRNFP